MNDEVDASRSCLAKSADRLILLPYRPWDFGDSIAFEAMLAASDAGHDERWSAFAHGFTRGWAAVGRDFRRLDCTAPGRAMVHLARRFDDRLLLDTATRLAEYLMRRPTLHGIFETWEHSPLVKPYGRDSITSAEQRLIDSPPAGVFVDCLHFDPPFFSALACATGIDRYLNASLDQAVGYIRRLQKPSGLFDHFALRGHEETFGPGWGRGQGWALLGMLDVLSDCRQILYDDARVVLTVESIVRLANAMMAAQCPGGHWFAVVEDASSGEEFSTAAFMAVGLARCADLGLGNECELRRAAARARHAVVDGMDDSGVLRNVSVAVLASTDPGHYAHVPRGRVVPWGQGPAVLTLAT